MSATNKLLVILGPTATGKSDLAVRLAQEFNGEIISADSRQVYRGLDIGTGKIRQEEMGGIAHYLLDVAEPNERFTVNKWKNLAEQAIVQIKSRGKLPIIVGGTGYYISALTDGREFPDIESDPEEQKSLESRPAADLLAELQKLDPRRAEMLSSQSESANKRRLARAIIIARELGAVPNFDLESSSRESNSNEILFIGLTLPDIELKNKIRARLISRIDAGMIEEVKKLHKNGLTFERLRELGLEYRYVAEFLQAKLTKEQLIDTLATKIWQYARRQKTWFKRDKRIQWFAQQDAYKIKQMVKEFVQ